MRKLVATTAIAATAAAGALAIPALAATRTVSVKDDVFSPRSLTVTKNTTVKWVWRGDNPHDVVVKSGPRKFKSSVKTSGSFSRRLTRAGTYRIICSIHQPEMKMTLRVR